MTLEEAIKYCEEHECEECPVAYENDKRNEFERMQFACCWNLITGEILGAEKKEILQMPPANGSTIKLGETE